MTLSEYSQVEEYVNKSDVSKKIIAISSIPDYNEEARRKGTTRIVHKDFGDLDRFSDQVVTEIEVMIGVKPNG